jgi:hypothetical protein
LLLSVYQEAETAATAATQNMQRGKKLAAGISKWGQRRQPVLRSCCACRYGCSTAATKQAVQLPQALCIAKVRSPCASRKDGLRLRVLWQQHIGTMYSQ